MKEDFCLQKDVFQSLVTRGSSEKAGSSQEVKRSVTEAKTLESGIIEGIVEYDPWDGLWIPQEAFKTVAGKVKTLLSLLPPRPNLIYGGRESGRE